MNEPNIKKIIDLVNQETLFEGLNNTFIEGVYFYKSILKTEGVPVVYKPSIHLVLSGSKNVIINDKVHELCSGNFMSIYVQDPIFCQITKASNDEPFLCVIIDIELYNFCDISMTLNIDDDLLESVESAVSNSIKVGYVDESLLDIVRRLLELQSSPDDIEYLSKIIMKEFYYRIASKKNSANFIQPFFNSTDSVKIIKIINDMKTKIDQPYIVEKMANEANMSVSKFHREFKRVTSVSPIQYLKKLRLTKARYIMISYKKGASYAASIVGYESLSHFCRDYTKLFGSSPKKDVSKFLK